VNGCFMIRKPPLLLAAALLAGCGGGGNEGENWARLRDFSLGPGGLAAPNTTETLKVRLDYSVDFESNTHLPTFVLTGHLLADGETLISPDTSVGRLVTQFCGQQAYACGDPFTRLCSVTRVWVDPSKRRVVCDSMNPAIEVPPGSYRFVGSACYTDGKGTRVCSSKSVPLVLG